MAVGEGQAGLFAQSAFAGAGYDDWGFLLVRAPSPGEEWGR